MMQFEGEETPFEFKLIPNREGLTLCSDDVVDASYDEYGDYGVLIICGFGIPVYRKVIGEWSKLVDMHDHDEFKVYKESIGIDGVDILYSVGMYENFNPVLSFEDVRVSDGLLSFKLLYMQGSDSDGRPLLDEERYSQAYLFNCNLDSNMFTVIDLISMRCIGEGIRGIIDLN